MEIANEGTKKHFAFVSYINASQTIHNDSKHSISFKEGTEGIN